ncbi:hypothetical protein OFB80_35505, partial [Escherichia coli]|nr:hypothetical protein [Escherichia coli]
PHRRQSKTAALSNTVYDIRTGNVPVNIVSPHGSVPQMAKYKKIKYLQIFAGAINWRPAVLANWPHNPIFQYFKESK